MTGRMIHRLLLAVALAGAALVLPGLDPAGAASFPVSSPAGTGPNTFVQAVADASAAGAGPHTIDFAPGLTVTVTQAATYTSAEALIINGNGSTLDAGGADVRALILSGSGPVTINDLTITNSVTTTGSGAVFASNSGDLTINDSTITGHDGTNGPGAILSNGAAATVSINRSVLSDNSSALAAGGAINATGPLEITDSLLTDNESSASSGGVYIASSDVAIERSTFSGNTAALAGGVGQSFDATATTTVEDSTFVDNHLTGAFVQGAAITTAGDLLIDHSLFSGNDGPATGVSQVDFGTPDTENVLTHSALVDTGADDVDCGGNILRDTGYTISTDDSCFAAGVGGPEPTDTPNFAGDPRMGPLRDNGGLVATAYPLAGSPLVDAILNGDCSLTNTADARSVPRPFPAGGACDIGPVEATYPLSSLTDVPAWVTDAIAWITSSVNDPQLMTGYDDDTFRANDPITRAQTVRMVYRLMGQPDVGSLPDHPFTDVPAWVDDAVTWAFDQNIVTGITATQFKPNDPITRAQVVRMEYRAVGSPAVSGYPNHPFTDVPAWVEEAVRWAANTDNPLPLVTGITPTKFKPDDNITRGQVARTTYRLAITPGAWSDPGSAAPTVPFVAPAP